MIFAVVELIIVLSMRKVIWAWSNFPSLKNSSSLSDHMTSSEQIIRKLILLDDYWSFRSIQVVLGRVVGLSVISLFWTIHSLDWRYHYFIDAFLIKPVFPNNKTSDYFIQKCILSVIFSFVEAWLLKTKVYFIETNRKE